MARSCLVYYECDRLPAEFRRNQIAVRTVLLRLLVHAADQPLPAGLVRVPDPVEHLVDLLQNGAVEGIVNWKGVLFQGRGRNVRSHEAVLEGDGVRLLGRDFHGVGVTRWQVRGDLELELLLHFDGLLELFLETAVFCFHALVFVLEADLQLQKNTFYHTRASEETLHAHFYCVQLHQFSYGCNEVKFLHFYCLQF